MDAAEQAVVEARRRGSDRAAVLNLEAFELERQAAERAVNEAAPEPTRSVLLRSAATLAHRCGEFREAERLVATALSGSPPQEIANELRELLDEINFSRHLSLRGLALQPDEVQLSIAGAGIGRGLAPTDELLRRLSAFQKLVHRTAERRAGMGYRETAAPPKQIKEDFQVFVSVPRAASFAVSIRIGRSKDQMELDPTPAKVLIDDVLDRLREFDEGHDDRLREAIKDDAYYMNFVALAKELAPSGTGVRMVGLTALRDSQERRVNLTRDRASLPLAGRVIAGNGQSIRPARVTGVLRFADELKPESARIKVRADGGAEYVVHVPQGMMSDIVRPLWGETVTIQGRWKGKSIELDDIQRADLDTLESHDDSPVDLQA